MPLTWPSLLQLQDDLNIQRVPRSESGGTIPAFTVNTHCETGDIAIPVPGEVGDSPIQTIAWLLEALIQRQNADVDPPNLAARNVSVVSGVPTVTYTFRVPVESIEAFPPNATGDELFT